MTELDDFARKVQAMTAPYRTGAVSGLTFLLLNNKHTQAAGKQSLEREMRAFAADLDRQKRMAERPHTSKEAK